MHTTRGTSHEAVEEALLPADLVGILTLAATGTIAAASLLGFLGSLWWVFELCSHFRVFYAMALACCAGLLLWHRRYRLSACAACLALLQCAFLLPFYMAPETVPVGSPTLRVFAANMGMGEIDAWKAADAIKDADPDLIVLMERPDGLRGLEGLLGRDYSLSAVRVGRNRNQIGLFTRISLKANIVSVTRHRTPVIVARTQLGDESIRLIAVHARSPINSEQASRRNAELMATADMAAESGDPAVVVGDLNITAWSPVFTEMIERGQLRDGRRGFGIKGTWPSQFPLRIPIDQCLVHGRAVVKSFHLGPHIGSDHLPVIVDIAVRPAETGAN